MINSKNSDLSSAYSRAFFLLLIKKKINLKTALLVSEALITLLTTKKSLYWSYFLNLSSPKLREELINLFTGQLSPDWINLILILIDDNNFALFLPILFGLEKFLLKKTGIEIALAYSVIKLEKIQLEKIKNKLEQKYHQAVKVVNKLDNQLIAGLTLEFQGMKWTNSYWDYLQGLKKDLKKML